LNLIVTPTLQADLQAESVGLNYKLNRLNGAIGSYTMQLEIATYIEADYLYQFTGLAVMRLAILLSLKYI
jgi:hypothetical protein